MSAEHEAMGGPLRHLAARTAEALRASGLKLAVAESLTGGQLTSSLVDVPGTSGYLVGSFVAYTDGMKTSVLGVPEETLAKHGAVSPHVAVSMATGARKAVGADIGIATTGVAGPDGAGPRRPVGLAFIAIDMQGDTYWSRLMANGDRGAVRETAVIRALEMLLDAARLHELNKRG